MKRIKIKISCRGLRLVTSDLNIGKVVLNRIEEDGVMDYAIVPKKVLAKWRDKLKEIEMRTAMHGLLGMVKDSLKFKPDEEIPTPNEKLEESKPDPTAVIKRVDRKQVQRNWTPEEDKYIVDNLNKGKGAKQLRHDAFLRSRHSDDAVRTRVSVIKNKRFKGVGEERGKMLEAYMTGKRISTPLANLSRNNSGDRVAVPKFTVVESLKNKAWSVEDLRKLKENKDLSLNELADMFPERTRAAVYFQKLRAQGRITKRSQNWGAMKTKVIKKTRADKGHPMTRWTDEETDAIRLNLDMGPKELKKLPWLKSRTINQICQKKYQLSKTKNES